MLRSSPGTPPAEVDIDVALVRSMLTEQHADLAAQPLEALDAGWDNAMFRLGTSLAVRMPRRQVAAQLVENEQRWLAQLPPLPLAIPRPIRVGIPAREYPWRWSIVPWIEGETADIVPPRASEAAALARFLKALHQPTPPDAPSNPYRGCALIDRRSVVEARLERLRTTTLLTERVDAAWKRGLAVEPSTVRVWIHGDLHARNVVVRDRRIVSVIDWGDLCAGDPATDLAGLWAIFDDRDAREEGIACYGASADLVDRARAWAIVFGAMLLESGRLDNARHAKMGADMLRRVSDEHPA